jgi:indolepyruvate ferredoxin oxidoreductase alpha subunit
MSGSLRARELLSGNQAIARGAWEAGVTVATGYPGTPSTEILEAAVKLGRDMHLEWSPNEKVALEVAAGASLAGARCIVTMKHVGLNVAADPLMTFSYTGTVGGVVIVVADDPGMHSSQNEQDSRHFARFAKVPLLEPADSQEALDFTMLGLEISETFRTPVLLRSTTRVSHSSGVVTVRSRRVPERKIGFEKDIARFVPVPAHARLMRLRVEERAAALAAAAEASPVNRIEWADRSLGVIAEGVAYQYVKEVLPGASVLKLGWPIPFPDALIRSFAHGVRTVLVVEELDDIMEEHVRSLGIACEGRGRVPGTGELSSSRLAAALRALPGRHVSAAIPPSEQPAALVAQPPAPPEAADLPARPPVLCPSCPHRGIFYALGKFDVVVTGDIGCYSLGAFAPLNRLDTILCMGGGISMAHGLTRAGEPRRVVGMVGDSTFFHSGITGLLDIAYNKGNPVIIVVDNRTTAMTGHQEHPGTGKTLLGTETVEAKIEDIARACGIRNVEIVNPWHLKPTIDTLRTALESDEAWLIVSRGACPLATRQRLGPPRAVDQELCTVCKACLKLGCPAIEFDGEHVSINDLLCNGCSMCQQVCTSKAIQIASGECRDA